MKKLLFGTVALVALGLGGLPAKAADMPVYSKAEPLPVWTFAGFYFGAHAGGARGTTHWTTNGPCIDVNGVFPLCEEVNQNPGGWVVGGQAGLRWQWGAWVFGLEGSLAAAEIKANDPSPCPAGSRNIPGTCTGLDPGIFDLHYDTRFSTLYSTTVQLGYAFNRTLWYVKGGWAGGEVRRKAEDISGVGSRTLFNNVFTGGETRQATGWTVGTGLEYLVLQNLSLGVEYDYFRLNASAFTSCILGGGQVCAVPNFQLQGSDMRADIHQVVVRANYRLDWGVLFVPDPPPAR
jgi:outer membrane immunogenic protein